jgi:hypothetical protein
MRRVVEAVGLLAAVVVAGCGNNAPVQGGALTPFSVPTSQAPAAASPAATTVPAFTPEQEEMFGPHVELPGGLLLKQIGKVAQEFPSSDPPNTPVDVNNWAWRLVVDKIEVDPKCDKYMPEPTRGHLVLITARLETSAKYDPSGDDSPLNAYEWSTVGPDGVSETSGYASCRAADSSSPDLRPSAKYRTTVAIDTANTSGQLVLANEWAWNYPA